MKHFEHNGKKVEFSAVTGEVSGTHKLAETHVSSSGGGGYISQGSGFVSAPKITSKVVVKQEFFLKENGGKQMPVQLSGMDIPLMDGQKVTMISAGQGRNSPWTHLVNHDAGLYWNLGNVNTYAIAWGLVRKPLFSFLIGVAMWIAIGYVVNGWVGFVAAVAFWVYEGMNLRNASKALNTHFDELGREMLTNGAASP